MLLSWLCVRQEENRSEFTHPELPSEDSMFVHPSYVEQETQSASVHTQVLLTHTDTNRKQGSKPNSVRLHISLAFLLGDESELIMDGYL